MGSKKDRFCITVDDKPRTLFSIEEKNDGDIQLIIKHAESLEYTNPVLPGEPVNQIENQKYSIPLCQGSCHLN